MESFEDVPGWLTREEADALARFAAGRSCLEFGSFCGRSSVVIAAAARSLHCVDTFDGRATPYPQSTLTRFRQEVNRRNLTDRIGYTVATFDEWAAVTSQTHKFDFAFLDGDHSLPATARAIEIAAARMNQFGVIALHDFGNADYPGVATAARSVFWREPDELAGSVAFYLLDGPPPGRTLNVVTPSVRVRHWLRLADELKGLAVALPEWSIRWHLYADRSIPYPPPDVSQHVYKFGRQPVGGVFGNAGRNRGLDDIADGWVWFLDDDNGIHPEFPPGLAAAVLEHPAAPGFVFDQYAADGSLRLVGGVNAGRDAIDTAQFVFRRGAIGRTRWVLDKYNADGIFYAAVCAADEANRPVRAGGAVWYNKGA